MISTALLTTVLMMQTPGPHAGDWRADYEEGKRAYAKRDFESAAKLLSRVTETADGSELFDAYRLLTSAHREDGNFGAAEQVLQQAQARYAIDDPDSERLARILEELAGVQRAQARDLEAAVTLDKAIALRKSHIEWPQIDLARDLTVGALSRLSGGDSAKAIEGFQSAIEAWDSVSPGDTQALPALEGLAASYRDANQYEQAEPLLIRALRLREAANGPVSSEIIATVDSLAYVEFGLRKFSEAEPLYMRLLSLWDKHGGPDHPMKALTLEKIAEFYAFQQKYEQAESFALDALVIRARMHVSALNESGRILIMQAKIDDAEDLYARAVKIGDLAKAPDDVMDPVLRTYAKILRELHRDKDARPLELRVREAIQRRAEREGYQTYPGQPQL